MAKKVVTDLDLKDKKVLVRVDFNVPMKDGKITNDNRIVAALPTIEYILEQNGKAILFSHLGKVKTEEDKEGKSLRPVAVRLSELLGKEVKFVPTTRGPELEKAIDELKDGEVLLFENTRFEDIDGKKESKNDPELGKYWASLGDVFVNDAFGTAHRAHASNVGIASNLESAAGFLMEKEIKFIGGVVDNPARPLVAILGGAKVSDKIGVIENLLTKADKVLVGGGMTFTFMAAQGQEIGKSLLEADKVELAKGLLEKAGDKLVLPVDAVVSKEFSNDAPFHTVSADSIPADEMGLDIGQATIDLFTKELQGAKTVVWNGPMGVFELSNFAKGTIGVCEAIANLTDATTIIGGGDSAAAAMDLGFADKFTHISTGGGASLEYLEGKELPGVASISDK
ncbi:phosphoglycerate kinase [Listeria monocytogenes]|jgi:phosphoglycerate kinase (EC 2.7.2.3)|uniref:Phosphoglycerate kinase n=4 Tax=Bacteria TaxID=2 RepID=PGK_LISMO|nr:phosphoglycerate kinase [Listeria monocytogenes]NP_465981.1 phosphoglycerate kinase [Listeria monocytogenes EGD-e]Q8Y4I2.1 RecName: Full=Phosphoglycerate kinase [Listeria monocytogenes EGD-e]EAA0166465.1 phosphoglycerate kinase [Listeria monocytogenes serotype 1/2a]EAD3235769.1 phosphoglycerate kinase [Listeria monocytogenes CFSAN002202]EAE3703445.1 phosphoglycerate kinase [Listeria monocytogenes serotype 1/2c]EAF4502559.1 phosphoglycerate kinase [Listeria monocytogenes serotype 4b]EAG625